MEAGDLWKALSALTRAGRSGVLLTVVRTGGSTPRKSAAKMLVTSDGTHGTIGGGRVEHEAIAAARGLLAEGYAARPALRRWHLTHDLAMCCGGEMEIFMEPLLATPRLFVCGGGHVAHALVPIATRIGFRCTVVEDLAEQTGAARFPEAASFVDDFDTSRWSELAADDYVVVVTRDHAMDQRLMESLLPRDLAYLGLIGSKRKIAMFKERLSLRGIDEARWENVHAPIGVDIGADTPEEIAVAIAAELVEVRARRRNP
ncbi:MAG: xanthine dehydrogenase accessory protein XdhC [Polyangia bacterium]